MGKNLGETLYKLLGIFAIIQAIRMLESVLHYLAIKRSYDSVFNPKLLGLAWLVPFLLLLVGGLFLMLRSRQLASRNSTDDEKLGTETSTASIHSSLLSAAGFLLIGFSLSDLPKVGTDLLIMYLEQPGMLSVVRNPITVGGNIASVLLPMSLGLLLVLKNSALVSVLRRRRDRTRPVAADAQCPHCGFWIVASDYKAGAPGYRCDNCKGEIPHDLIDAAQRAAEPRA